LTDRLPGPDLDPDREYTVTFAAWYLFNVAMVLAMHRARRRRPWL